MILVSTRKGLFHVDHDGTIAQTGFLGDPVTLAGAANGSRYAFLRHGHYGPKVHRSDDAGKHWTEVGRPAFPKEEGAPSVDTIWAFAGSAGRLWCGTVPGGLFTSDDRGESWQFVQSLWELPERARWFGGGFDEPGIHSICPHPEVPDEVLVGVSCGGVWRSQDRGDSWQPRTTGMRATYMPPDRAEDPAIQDPHRIVRSPSHPDVLWCQHHNGCFRSVDNAKTWTELDVPPTSFGFPVAVHPHDPDTAWFVPAQSDEKRIPVGGAVVVARTQDGGESFEILADGLPQQHAYDLVFRHALDVDASGEVLAMGSTTGSLWISLDGGRRWRLANAHLPPIYAVCFV